MRRFIIIIFFLPIFIKAQNRANIWELGYSLYSSPKCELKYSNGIMDTIGVSRVMTFFETNVSICNTAGNLLFYSNGITIGNRNFDTLENAVNFNPGWATDFNDPFGMSTCQGMLILPDPGDSNRYYVFHESGEGFIAYNASQVQPLHLSYSVVDMNLDSGLGGIVDTLKNKFAIVDTLLWGGLTAVKHANGRDWWVIVHRFYNDKYYKLLLTPDGLQGPFEQIIGSNLMYDAGVQANFSPDGSKYCISNLHGWFDYMNFDRCIGEFSNPVSVFSPDSSFYGSSFSTNSRFIYASSLLNLYQYDTWDSNMVTDVIHIAKWDSFFNPLYNIPVLFFMHQLGSDGKIYISPGNGVEYLNVLNSPDSLGLSCDFTPHSFLLNSNTYTNNIPSFPNYDLNALEGSPCDTIPNIPLGIASPEKYYYRITPNPVGERLNIIYNNEQDVLLTLYNVNGKAVSAISLFHYFKNRLLDVKQLPSGVYLAIVTSKGETIWSEKVIVQH